MADNTSYWSGVSNGNNGNVGSGRSAFFRVSIPEDVNPADLDSLSVKFTVQTTHNSGNISLSLFSLNEALPATVSSAEAQGAQGSANKALYTGKAFVATSNTVVGGAAAGTPVTFDLSAYAKANPQRV
jgi:hypothetical protein